MSPILVRPVREQLEHDRVIRLLQVKLKRKHEVIANIGEDQSTSVKIGQLQIFPDLVLTTADRAASSWALLRWKRPNRSITWRRVPNGPTWAGRGPPSTCMCRLAQ